MATHDLSVWAVVVRQFRSLVVLLLLTAAAVAAGLGEVLEAAAILAALLVNAGIGFATECRARMSLAKLRALATPEAVVWRAGLQRVPAADLVPGDVVVLEAGANVPADGRLIRSTALQVSEAALTGEDVPVEKQPDARLTDEASLVDRATIGVALVICAVVAVVGILHGQPLGLMVETAISLAVAAIAEASPP